MGTLSYQGERNSVKAFLITFKAASENPENGWPIEDLRRLVEQSQAGRETVEPWRFRNRKDVSFGDRVFLLRQGKGGPAVIGYGDVAGPLEKADAWMAPVRFEVIVDPTSAVLITTKQLRDIPDGARFWRIQSSGVLLPAQVASALEALVTGAQPQRNRVSTIANPDWSRDELILALDLYLKHRPNLPGKDTDEIRQLSTNLTRLGEKLFRAEDRSATFRNTNGVYMKLMNFRRLDPQYTLEGRTGLPGGGKAEVEVWTEFAEDALRCRRVADAIMASLDDPEVVSAWIEPESDDQIQEAAEGRLLTQRHLVRERNRQLISSKRKQVLKRDGKLVCEACAFDFGTYYGKRGEGFIECHHTKPIASLAEGHKTHVDDLALVCANCHRVIHRSKPWLTMIELKAIIKRSYR
jgi:5-methylcytosine-specific restriction protein A